MAVCQLATPEEIAAAAGLKTKLTLQDYDTVCSYDGGEGSKHVLISVASQDAANFKSIITQLGGVEVPGPGDTILVGERLRPVVLAAR